MTGFPLMVENYLPIMPLRAALSVFIFLSSFPLGVKTLLLVLDGLVGVEAVCPHCHCKDTIIIGGGSVTPRVHSGLTYPTARARDPLPGRVVP